MYFKNKEEIVFAIWDIFAGRHRDAFAKRVRDDMSAKEKILEFYNFSECDEDQNKEQVLMLYQHFVSSMLIDKTGLYTAYFESFFQEDYDFLSSALNEGIKRGEFQVDNIDLLINTIIMLLKGILVRAKASNMGFVEAQSTLIKHINYLLDIGTRKEP